MIKPLQSITLKNDNGEDTTYVVATAPAIVETTEPADVASFSDGAEGIPVISLIADITPVQNLNGQSAPYPAGGGKNLVEPFKATEGTSYGLTMTPNADGSVRVHGTASNSSSVLLSMKSVNIPLPTGTYTFNIGITSSSNKVYGQIVTGAHTFFSRTAKDTYTVASDTTITRLDIGCNAANGEQIDVTIYPQLEVGSTATTFAPYSNICPITGRTGMNVVRTGKNLIDDSIRYKSSNQYYIGNQNTYTILLAAGTYTFSVDFLNGSHYGAFYKEVNATSGTTIWGSSATTSSETITLPAGNYMFWLYKSGGVTETDIGNVQLEVGSSPTTYAPYNGTIYLTDWGINQWDEEWEVGGIDASTGANTIDSTTIRSKNYIPVIAGETYYVKNGSNATVVVHRYDANKNYLGNNNRSNATITLSADTHYIKLRFSTTYGTTYKDDTSINYPSTETGYHKYADPHAGIVYGGTLDVTTGLLTVTHAYCDLGDVDWLYSSVAGHERFGFDTPSQAKAPSTASDKANIICSMYGTITANDTYQHTKVGIAMTTNGYRTYVYDPRYTDVTTFKAAMSGVDFVYELATPQTYQLTPQTVTTILGQNNIWADTGDVEVSYVADTKLYIDNVIAAL